MPRHVLVSVSLAYLLLCALVAASAAPRGIAEERIRFTRGRGDVYAVVVGLADYADPGIRDLEYADNDARAFAAFLRSAQGGHVPTANIKLLVDRAATLKDVRSALLDWLPTAANKKDHTAIVFFSGHGVLYRNDPLFLVHDTEPGRLGGTGLPMDVVEKAFGMLEAERTLFFSDACHSGAIGGVQVASKSFSGNMLVDRLSGSGRVIITSSRDDQNSYESDNLGAGFFTHYLLEGLKGPADTDRDGYVDVNEAYRYTYDRVADAAGDVGKLQHPRMGGQFDGVLLLSQILELGPPPPNSQGIRLTVNVDAMISVDGEDYAQASGGTTISIDLAPGTHTVRAEAPARTPDERTVTVAAGARTDVSLNLVALPGGGGPPGPTIDPNARGALYIKSEPAGATVWIGGQEVGETPATASDLTVGPHQVRVELDLYHPYLDVIQVIPGVKWLEPIELRPNFGPMSLESDPPGALLYLGGPQVGETPYEKEGMKSGTYEARLVLPWYHDWEGTITVQDEVGFEDRIVLRPAFGSLSVRSEPSGATVFVDADSVGTTPLTLPRVRSGSRSVKVRKELYALWTTQVEIIDGESASVSAPLESRFGGLSIDSQPQGMPVEVDGRRVGVTPVTVHPIGVGSHSVAIGKGEDGYNTYEGTAEVQANETRSVKEDLLPRLGNLTVYSEPAEAAVSIDGEEQEGLTPLTVRGLLAGTHKIEVKKGELIYEGEARIGEGLTETLQCPLQQPFRGGEMVEVKDRGFWIDKHEVTNAQYAEFVRATGHRIPICADRGKADWNTWRGDRPPAGYEDHPVVGVSSEDAAAYCQWAGRRLPTKEEWQQACQGTGRRAYPWGNAYPYPSAQLANFGRSIGTTAPVGSYTAGRSPYGALDMSGNVWEWTASGSGTGRAVRGGSWVNDPYAVRCTYRYYRQPSYRGNFIGFRCARGE